MEHRYCQRIETPLFVSLWHGDQCWGTYETGNLSEDGLFLLTGRLEMERIIKLRRTPLVKLRFKSHGNTAHWMSGFVVHRSGEGIGMLLTPPNSEYLSWVQRLLARQDPVPRANTTLPRSANG